nr:hypothetical protein L203_04960 [Cryptococcus depauperatus CBS 7841]
MTLVLGLKVLRCLQHNPTLK